MEYINARDKFYTDIEKAHVECESLTNFVNGFTNSNGVRDSLKYMTSGEAVCAWASYRSDTAKGLALCCDMASKIVDYKATNPDCDELEINRLNDEYEYFREKYKKFFGFINTLTFEKLTEIQK